MTRWPLCLAEIALYAVLAGLVLWMVLDARERWKQLLEDQDEDEQDGNASEQDDGAEVSTVRPKDDDAPNDPDPPPAA